MHPARQTVSIGDFDLHRIDIGIRKRALVEERGRNLEMETLRPVRKLDMTIPRPRWDEVAHARARQALLDFTVACSTHHPAD